MCGRTNYNSLWFSVVMDTKEKSCCFPTVGNFHRQLAIKIHLISTAKSTASPIYQWEQDAEEKQKIAVNNRMVNRVSRKVYGAGHREGLIPVGGARVTHLTCGRSFITLANQ